jgi:hypothetical protein
VNVGKSTEQLIADLSGGLTAVRPLRPPIVRALQWLAVAALLAAALVLMIQSEPAAARLRHADPRLALELAATLITGIVSIIAAFHLAIPGRAGRWALAPLPSLLVWLACSGIGCLQYGFGTANYDCFVFVVALSVPLALLLLWFLRRARPIAPLPVALIGGLGVAAVGAFVLQFVHPFDVTVLDLVVHAAAVAVVLIAFATAGRRVLG